MPQAACVDREVPIDCCSQRVLMPPMSIRRSALQLTGLDDRPHSQPGSGRRALAVATRYLDLARIWVRKAMAPGGVTGVIMALVFIVATDVFLLLTRYLQVLPPVSLTFIIVIVVVALRWGVLSAIVTAVGGTLSLTFFFYSPFYTNSVDSRSRVLGVVFFLIVSLVLGYLAAKTRRGAARALERENGIRDLYTFSQRISSAPSPTGMFAAR